MDQVVNQSRLESYKMGFDKACKSKIQKQKNKKEIPVKEKSKK